MCHHQINVNTKWARKTFAHIEQEKTRSISRHYKQQQWKLTTSILFPLECGVWLLERWSSSYGVYNLHLFTILCWKWYDRFKTFNKSSLKLLIKAVDLSQFLTGVKSFCWLLQYVVWANFRMEKATFNLVLKTLFPAYFT